MKHPSAAILAALCLLCLPLSSQARSFPDTDGHRYEDAIASLEEDGIIRGYPDGRFRPDRTVNRAELTVLALRAANIDEDGSAFCFADVHGGWFAAAVCSAREEGIVMGYSDGLFRPHWEVTYAEAAMILARAFDLETDSGPWYRAGIEALEDADAAPETLDFPDQFVTRGEVAAMLDVLRDGDSDEDDDDEDEDDEDDDEEDDGDEDLTLSVEADDETVEAGDIVEFTITIENDGDDEAEVTVRAELDEDMHFEEASDDGEEEDDEEVVWEDIEIDEDEEVELTLEVEIDEDADEDDELTLTVEVGDEEEEVTVEIVEEDDDEEDGLSTSRRTYFGYSPDEVNRLRSLGGRNETLDAAQLYAWDGITMDIVRRRGFAPTVAGRLYAAVTVAQRDVILLGEQVGISSPSAVDAVSKGVICHVSPEDCVSLARFAPADTYASELSALVQNRMTARLNADPKTVAVTPLVGNGYWVGTNPVTPEAGSWQFWANQSQLQRLPPPPFFGTSQDLTELDAVRVTLASLTPQRMASFNWWAGSKGTETPAGIWLGIADRELRDAGASAVRAADVRATVAIAMADGFIASWREKFTYWTARPTMRDAQMVALLPVPNFPSYPSGHSTISPAAAKVLGAFFPDHTATFDAMALEASDSRVWSGIHFPVDCVLGMQLGTWVGDSVVRWHG